MLSTEISSNCIGWLSQAPFKVIKIDDVTTGHPLKRTFVGFVIATFEFWLDQPISRIGHAWLDTESRWK